MLTEKEQKIALLIEHSGGDYFPESIENYAKVQAQATEWLRDCLSTIQQLREERETMSMYISTVVSNYYHVMSYGMTQKGLELVYGERPFLRDSAIESTEDA